MAGRIRDEDIALVRERTSIVDVVSERVTLRNAGGRTLKGLCPFHDEKTPSFTVASDRNVYYCHGCGSGGDAIRFVMETDHLTFVESVERLADKAGIQLRYIEAGPAGQPLDRLDERQVLGLHDEPDGVATDAATVAEVHVAGRGHGERRGLLVVERAQPLQVARAGGFQRHLLGDHVDDRGALTYQCDVLVADLACHGAGHLRPPSCPADPRTAEPPASGTRQAAGEDRRSRQARRRAGAPGRHRDPERRRPTETPPAGRSSWAGQPLSIAARTTTTAAISWPIAIQIGACRVLGVTTSSTSASTMQYRQRARAGRSSPSARPIISSRCVAPRRWTKLAIVCPGAW